MREIKLAAGDRPVRTSKSVKTKKTRTAPRRTAKRKPATSAPSVLSTFWGSILTLFRFVGRMANLLKALGKIKTSSGRAGRRRPQPKWRRYAIPGALVLAITVPVGLTGYYIVKNSVVERTLTWIDKAADGAVIAMGLSVQEISVAGRERTSAKDIVRVLSLKRGDNILQFDPSEARSRIESLGWVETASVMRRFPDEIFIRITERRPFARWQRRNQTAVIDRNGAVISEQDNEEFRYLPKVVGVGANKDAAALFDVLAKAPTLFTRLNNAVRIRDRRWNLEFENGIIVLLPEQNSGAAWAKLDKMQQEQGVLNKGVTSIDLRSTRKTYVRLKPDDAEFRRVAGEET